jgi:hypothetical protein
LQILSKKQRFFLHYFFSFFKKQTNKMSGAQQLGQHFQPVGNEKRIANHLFGNHPGRRGVQSATRMTEHFLRGHNENFGSIRAGPMGMGMISPAKPTALPSGQEGREAFSHFHSLHEYYNEK